MTGQREVTWRETVPGEYWKCGDYRIEFLGGEYFAFRFPESPAHEFVEIARKPTWDEAAKAVEKEMDE